MSIDKDLLDRPMEGRSPAASFGKEGVPTHLTKTLAEPAVRAEALPEGANPLPNRRNGSSPKTATTDSGKMLPGIPRHRNGYFDPIPIAKDRRRFPEVDTRILGLYAHGMTARESQGQTCTGHLPRHSMSFASYKDRNAEAAEAGPVEVEGRDLAAKYPVPAPNWRSAPHIAACAPLSSGCSRPLGNAVAVIGWAPHSPMSHAVGTESRSPRSDRLSISLTWYRDRNLA